MKARFAALAISLFVCAFAHAGAIFINGVAIPGNLGDKFGTSVNNGRVGFFSDLYFDPNRNEWWGLSDRGPGGGTLSYNTRVQRFTLNVDPTTGAISAFHIADTVVFTMGGAPLNGQAPSPTNVLGRAFDPEGIVVNPRTGNLLVSDEYGPSLYEFSRSGQFVRAYVTPFNIIPRDAATGVPNYADDTGNTAGKRTNRGFEGLAISPDGRYAYAVLQSPMLDEGGGANGRFTRIVKFDTATGLAVAQYAYLMDRSGQGQGISSLVALNDHEFLVLERNNRGVGVGAELNTPDKSVYRIDLTGADDVTGTTLPPNGTTLPGGLHPVTKLPARVADLDADTLAALGNKSPEKWEGLTIGPRLSDGSYVLIAGTDNDYSVTQDPSGAQRDVYFRFTDADPYATSIQCPLGSTTGCTGPLSSVPSDGTYALLPGVLHAYRLSGADIAGYIAPAAPIPEPASSSIMLLGLVALVFHRKRR